MTNYGKLWQQVADIRADLKNLVPLFDTGSLSAARLSADIVRSQLDRLLKEWEKLEEQMAKEPDNERLDWRAEGCEDHSCASCWDCELYLMDIGDGVEHRCTNPRNKKI